MSVDLSATIAGCATGCVMQAGSMELYRLDAPIYDSKC
jgi:hypothetical protein